MTWLFDNPAQFADESLEGFVAAFGQYVTRVDGGVVRSTVTPQGQVALVIGGGSGHYPAFAGLVGPGLAAGSVCGNMFASPAAAQVYRVSKIADRGAGVLLSYGNYAGDVLHFSQAEQRLRREGMDVRTVVVTDDIASAQPSEKHKRRGIAGDMTVFKVAGAAAEAGCDLDEVERLARKANDRTRTLGVAFSGCTLPGATEPLFRVDAGIMSLGLGIHGEPGISEQPMPAASELAGLLVDRLLEEKPEGAGNRVVAILNGLGTVKYEELFLLYGKIDKLLRAAGLEVFEPECGELVTSLDMAGLSLTLFWIDDELAGYWSAPADTPAYRKGSVAPRERVNRAEVHALLQKDFRQATDASRRLAVLAEKALTAVRDTIVRNQDELGRIDAIAGDGDHGIGMVRGAEGAADAAAEKLKAGAGIEELLTYAGEQWSERAGGTSGALWGAGLVAVAQSLGNEERYDAASAVKAAKAAQDAVQGLGKAQLGDKTMVDAMIPFVEALEKSVESRKALSEALMAAAEASQISARATSQLRPKLGRARPLAEKSLGHPDAGAISFAMIMQVLAEQVR